MTFRDWQAEYGAFGIATFPISIEPERKKPLVKNYARFGVHASAKIAERFANATAIGFMAGKRNRITVVDVDTPDESVLRSALERHGQSPIIVRSGSGHHQAWYRWNGEQRRIRPFGDEYPIDILGGGVVVAPPSHGIKADYKFVQGGLDDLRRLQPIEGLPEWAYSPASDAVLKKNGRDDLVHLQPVGGLPEKAYSTAPDSTLRKYERTVSPGVRNDTLFRECMKAAPSCHALDQLLDVASVLNAEYSPPLPDEEVVGVAKSAWKYEESGTNWIGRGGRIVPFSHSEVELLAAPHADALALLAILRMEHWARSVFVLSKEMADFLGWSLRRFKAAREHLIKCGKIRCVHPGGRGPHDPPKFQLI